MTIPLAVFTEARPQYDYDNEAQFRREVVRTLQELQQYVAAADVSGTPATMAAGDNDDYALGDDTSILRLTPHASGSTLTGMVTGKGERRLTIINIGTTDLTLAHEDAGSAANNRFKSPSGDIVLGPDEQAFVLYDPTTLRWRVNASATQLVGCTAYRSSAFGLTNSTATPIEWNAEAFDTSGIHDNSTNPSRFTVPLAGKYRVNWGFTVSEAGTGGSEVSVGLRVDGVATSYGLYQSVEIDNGLSQPFSGACDLDVAASSYIELYITATAGGTPAWSIQIGGWMGVHYLG